MPPIMTTAIKVDVTYLEQLPSTDPLSPPTIDTKCSEFTQTQLLSHTMKGHILQNPGWLISKMEMH